MQILLFGVTKEIIGKDFLKIPSDINLTDVGQLKSFLMLKYPELAKISSLAVAVNNHYAEDKIPVNVNDEIALIPPVSGG